MIDIHFHCLPGIDDGPEEWNEAVALCRAALADGVETIVATPHVLRHPWINEDRAALESLVRELNQRVGGSPRVVPGCEYFFSGDAIELWELGDSSPLIGLNGGKHLLMEFPATLVPANAESVIHELTIHGVTPVIAHPERNGHFMQNPARLRRMVAMGAITQVTAASVSGDFGRRAQAAADELVRLELVHCVASDSHSTSKRPPRMTAARERVTAQWGADLADELFERAPAAIVGALPAPAEERAAHVE